MRPRNRTPWAPAPALLAAFLVGVLALPAAAQVPTLNDQARRLGRLLEQDGRWLEASNHWGALLRKDRANATLRDAYVRCLRHVHIARRHGDPSYEAALQQITPSQALDVYQQVLLIIPAVYVDRYRTGLPELFASGIQELLYALEDETFQRLYLPGAAGSDTLKEFRKRLAHLRDRRAGPLSREQAREQVLGIGQLAQDLDLPVRRNFQAVVALEMACGACNALDEYTLFLTPGSAANEALGLDVPVGVGIDVAWAADQQQFVVGRVFPRGPAEVAEIAPQDRLVRINGQMLTGLTPEAVQERLRGAAGSTVQVEVLSPTHGMRTLTLERRACFAPTVEYRLLGDPMGMAMPMPASEPVGYLRILHFQHSTVQEVREALVQLQTQGVRAIVLDLRGNGGGLFESSIQVAELFLPEGQVVTRGESPVEQFNRPFPVQSSNPLALPLAVLVDENTASAAEVLAGALKAQNRGRLFGQPTYGKGLIQCIVPVTRPGQPGRLATALKITVARFFTPGKEPVDLRGIAPHDVMDPHGETPILAARLFLVDLLRSLNVR